MKKIIFTTIVFIASLTIGTAQKKYALIIGGDPGPELNNIPQTDRWNNGDGMSSNGYDEFWNDTYLMWEMLVTDKGYDDDNVFVLFNYGNDFDFPQMNSRYKAEHHLYTKVTDESATEQKVHNVFNYLAGIVEHQDFLFVWIMSHCGDNNPYNENDGNGYLYLADYPNTTEPDYDGLLFDDELKSYLDNINAHKKVVMIQAQHSGRFASKLGNDNTIIFTSSDKTESSFKADDQPETENEVIEGITYSHGEFNFHIYSSLVGETPVEGNSTYNYQNLISAPDINEDLHKSVYEAIEWELQLSSVNETAQLSDQSSIKENTAFEYPTIIFKDINANANFIGIVGVTKRFYILNNTTATFEDAEIILANEEFYIKNGSNLSIGNE